MKLKIDLSKNCSKNIRKTANIKFIIIHYTGMQSKRASIERLKSKIHKVSCHYLIDRKGQIIQMVPDNKVAWHAGLSKWKNFKNLNDCSIGIELVNRGLKFGYQNFSSPQIKKLILLCNIIKKKYQIKNSNILSHSDVAPLRKTDPGEKFPWFKLKIKGLGIWYPKKLKQFSDLSKIKTRKVFFDNLHKIGYRYFNKNKTSNRDRLVIKAFQRRFIQDRIDGKISQKCLQISHYLAVKSKN
ncbi:MAG: N-acetylmuramoyl-L-alanine amidase [Pelagibacteraceae bacterium]